LATNPQAALSIQYRDTISSPWQHDEEAHKSLGEKTEKVLYKRATERKSQATSAKTSNFIDNVRELGTICRLVVASKATCLKSTSTR
jgi:molybdopterin-biosynthesis enzyme MoeA-like protein